MYKKWKLFICLTFLSACKEHTPINEQEAPKQNQEQTKLPSDKENEVAPFIWDLEFSSSGNQLVATGTDGATIWNLRTGTKVAALNTKEELEDAEISPDGKTIATTSNEGTKLWSLSHGALLATLNQDHGVDLEFSQDGSLLATTNIKNKTTSLWDPRQKKLLFALTQTDFLRSVEFSPDGTRLLTKSDASVWLWDAAKGELIANIKVRNELGPRRFSADSKSIVTRSTDERARNTVSLWEAQTGALRRALPTQEKVGWNKKVNLSPDDSFLLLCGEDRADLLSAITGEVVLSGIKLAPGLSVKTAIFSPNGESVAVGLEDGTVQLWDIKAKSVRARFQTNGDIFTIAFSPDGAQLAVSHDNTVTLLRVETGALLYSFKDESSL
jgi:WD40 repeat protein